MVPTYQRTQDGDLAARIEHVTLAMIPSQGTTLNKTQFRVASCYPAIDPTLATRGNFTGASKIVNNEVEFKIHVSEIFDHYQAINALARKKVSKQRHTPWGMSQQREEYSKGIEQVSSASHGGFLLDAENNDIIDPEWRNDSGAYEEDQLWAIVAFTFPHLFTKYELNNATTTLKNDFPEIYERLTDSIIPIEESEAKRRREWDAAHSQSWVVFSASKSKTDPNLTFCVAGLGGKRGESRYFLVDLHEYSEGYRPYGFVIDLNKHQQCDSHGLPLPPMSE